MAFIDISKEAYTYLKNISYLFLFISSFGLSKYAPDYLDELNIFIKIFICSFLIYRFNPINGTTKFDDFDKTIVFDSAIYLLSTSLIINALEIIIKRFNNVIERFTNYDIKQHKNKKK